MTLNVVSDYLALKPVSIDVHYIQCHHFHMSKQAEPKPHETVRSQLRLPAGLHQQLLEAVQKSGRSMNAEIVHRLEGSFRNPTLAPGVMGIRATIAAERENAMSTVEMLQLALDSLRLQAENVEGVPYPGQTAGKSVEEAITDTSAALETFKRRVKDATFLLTEIAVAEAQGIHLEVDEVRARAREKLFLL